MRRLRLLSLPWIPLCLGLPLALAAAKVKPSPDEAPQLISTEEAKPKWKNTKELKAYAAKGDPQACFELGVRLLDGDSELPADLAQARTLLETAAARNVAYAKFRLGKMYADGRGVSRDYDKALEYYIAAARRGVPEAQHNIGAMLVSARGVKRDYVEGLAWFLLAEQAGLASTSPQQVRDRLAKRPDDIRAAEARAMELYSDLAHATVRPASAAAAPIAAPAVTKPAAPPMLSPPKIDPPVRPKIEPPAPPKIEAPTLPPAPAPR
jgi:uncharacterized protein